MPTGKKEVIFFAICAIIITVIIVYMFPVSCRVCNKKEGFEVPLQLSCPSGSNSFYDRDSNLLCCEGNVNGNICEGRILCTFSDSRKYPKCNKQVRHKFIGQINPFIAQVMAVGFVEKFQQILTIMNTFSNTLKSLPKDQISKADIDTYNSLLREEEEWYSNSKESPSILYQEECMYIIQRLTALFQGKPIMNNRELIQNEIKKQVCAL